jgi:3-deoxy-D-manno-octulosonic-acid transferase
MAFLYHIAIHLYYLIILAVSPFNPKAHSWIRGRLGWRSRLLDWRKPGDQVIWVHAASLGEFEQGRTLIDEVKTKYPEYKLLLTFFSPSGFEIRKNYPGADHVMYLPLDTCYNARRFVKLVNPTAVFFIKYEFWYYYLRQLWAGQYPVYLISAIFRPGQVFFKWFGYWYKKSLTFIDFFFVQDEPSKDLLNQAGIFNCMVCGDTRFDRVTKVAEAARDIPLARIFAEKRYCFVAGSTWPEDEEFLSRYINNSVEDTCFIIAPHEISETHLNRLSLRLARNSVLFSQASPDTVQENQVLIIDNIGMLSSLYRYGRTAYIGGGFGKGIHNILEAAAFGIPVVFGPNYHKFREACKLIEQGGAFSIKNSAELSSVLDMLRFDQEHYTRSSRIAGNYVRDNTGATFIILDHVFNKFQNCQQKQ